MSENNRMSELDPSTIDEEPSSRPDSSHGLPKSALGGLAAIIVIAVLVPWLTISSKREQVIDTLQQRMRITVEARAEVISTWLDGTAHLADRLVESELFKLFASDVDSAGGMIDPESGSQDNQDSGLGIALVEQLPYMERVLTDFVVSADFLTGYVVGSTGVAYVTSGGAEPLSPRQAELALAVLESGERRFGLPRTSPAGLVMDIYQPVLPVASLSDDAAPIGVVMVVAPVAERLAETLEPRPLAPEGERLHLVHRTPEGMIELLPTRTPEIRVLDETGLNREDQAKGFEPVLSLDGRTQVFATSAPIIGDEFLAVLEMEQGPALSALRSYTFSVIATAVLIVLAVIAVSGAVWAQLRSSHNRMMAEQFRRLAARIQTQKRFLDSINGSIADFIGLKAPDGRYRYVNSAFADALGRTAEEIVGLDDSALFGQGTAERLALSDRKAMESGKVTTSDEEIYLEGKRHYLQFSKLPFHDDRDGSKGVISVVRDVTELIEEQRKRDRAVRQMVTALVRAIELRDPYLAGHSRRVAQLAVAVGQRLQLPAQEISTLEIAANLSQLGKLAIRRELLTKPDRLNDAEIAEIKTHLDHAATMLRDIDFELPILPTIYQMHERLDGDGYPMGLKGGDILLTAQILGICDVFAARVEPRSYRSGLSEENALKILAENEERYAPSLVTALRDVVGSVAGEKLLAGLQSGN